MGAPLLGVNAKTINQTDVTWISKIIEKQIKNFNICGSADILLNKKSLNKDFFQGVPPRGYFFTEMISYQEFLDVLASKNLLDAKVALLQKFNISHLWIFTEGKGLEDFGVPSKIDLPFTATIKDCVEGAKTTLGNDCSSYKLSERRSCCAEKFSGPSVYWGKRSDFKLMYSPDPSVRLKVFGESKHRYCNVQSLVIPR